MIFNDILFFQRRPLLRNIIIVVELLFKVLHYEIFQIDAFHFNKVSKLLFCIILSFLIQGFYLYFSLLFLATQLQLRVEILNWIFWFNTNIWKLFLQSLPKSARKDLTIVKCVTYSVFHLPLQDSIELLYGVIHNFLLLILKLFLKLAFKFSYSRFCPRFLIANSCNVFFKFLNDLRLFCFDLFDVLIFGKYFISYFQKFPKTIISDDVSLFLKAFFNFILYFLYKLVSDALNFFFNISLSFPIILIEYIVDNRTNIFGEV